MENGHFVAQQVLAKHDETYMPKEVAEAIAKAKAMKRDVPATPPQG
jgi:cytochrome c-type biogenesis protein CcmE